MESQEKPREGEEEAGRRGKTAYLCSEWRAQSDRVGIYHGTLRQNESAKDEMV